MNDVETDQTLTLRDGRTLGYAMYGPKDGTPVVHFNGSGCSRLEHPPQLGMLDELNIRFISTDRPGHGLSDPHANRSFQDWTNDVAQLADHLSLERFYVDGWSAGGPYALACAHYLPERVIAGASLSGLAPYDRPDPYKGLGGSIRFWMFLCRCIPTLVTPFRRMMFNSISKAPPGKIGKMMSEHGLEADKHAISSKEAQDMMDRNVKEGYRQGWKGPVQDDLLVNDPWPFELAEIQTRFDVWQGALDLNVPLHQGECIHDRLPNSTLRVLENEGHLFPVYRWKEILEELIRP